MSGRTLFRIGLLLGVSTLAVNALSQSHQAAGKEVSIGIALRSPVLLTPTEHQKLKREIRAHGWDNAEAIVRELYQEKGYFKVQARAIQTPSLGSKTLVLQVDPGRQYHLVSISWRGNAALTKAELTHLIPFESGELFSKSKIEEGLNSAKKLYDSRGYINYIVIPTPLTDDSAGTIAFEMDVDEGEQFQFGELDVQGMEEAHREILLSAWQGLRGRPYNAEDADKFFNQYFRSPRRGINPANFAVRRIDERKRSVNYSLRFVPWIRYRVTRSLQLGKVESP
ncbi:MAG TPA: POTRA domain-containing protein [Terriglobales bacterium]|nr:POTRA domain-containing protein [Terriglobales bacterium]